LKCVDGWSKQGLVIKLRFQIEMACMSDILPRESVGMGRLLYFERSVCNAACKVSHCRYLVLEHDTKWMAHKRDMTYRTLQGPPIDSKII
jgi:hypothetical protein